MICHGRNIMELSNTAISLLNHIEQPAFCVRNGLVVGANASAEQRQILRSTDVNAYIADPNSLTNGSCTVKAAGTEYQATASLIDDTLLIILEADNTQAQLQSLALAAQHFRAPLSNVMALTEMLLSDDDLRQSPGALSQAIRLNRSLNQIQRMVCDMSDTWQYANWKNVRKTTVDIAGVIREIMEKASTALESADIHLKFTGLDQPLLCSVDVQMLERAIYNLISNSVKFSEGSCTVEAKLTVCGNMLHFSIIDSGNRIPGNLHTTVFSRFLREPGIEDGIFGIGLGMMLIRSVAAAHGGAVLIDHPQEDCNRVTMTMEITTDNSGQVSTPILSIGDYAGGRDHALLELSDILPPEMYDPKKY